MRPPRCDTRNLFVCYRTDPPRFEALPLHLEAYTARKVASGCSAESKMKRIEEPHDLRTPTVTAAKYSRRQKFECEPHRFAAHDRNVGAQAQRLSGLTPDEVDDEIRRFFAPAGS